MNTASSREQDFLSAVLENAGALVVVLDREGRIRRFNRASEKLSGYTFTEVEGKFPWETFLLPGEADAVRRNAFESLARSSRTGPGKYTNYWVGKTGERFLTEWSNTLLLDADGRMEFMVCVGIDITEKQRAEQTLRTSEQRLRNAEQMTHVGTWERDLITDEGWWSDEQYRMMGIAKSNGPVRQDAFVNLVHPDDRESINNAYRELFAKGAFDGDFRIVRPDGEVRHIHAVVMTHFDSSGRPLRLVGANLDITERKRIEARLRRNEAWLRHAQAIAEVGSWELDLATDSLKWSDETSRIFDRDPARYGSNYAMFLDAVHPADREAVDRTYRDAVANHATYDVTHRIVRPDGALRWVQERGETIYDEHGKALRTIGAVQDITERKRLEQAKRDTEHWFQGVYNSIEEAILVVSPDRKITAINPAAEKMFGYSPDEVKNQSTEIFHVSHEHYLEFGARIRDAFSKNITADFEYQAKRKNGEIFPTEHSVSLLRNDAGEILGIVSVIRDITERKQREALLNTSNQIVSAVLDTTPVLIAYLDTDMNFVRVNAAYAAADQAEPEHFIGKNHFTLYPNAENEAIFRRVAETGEPHMVKARPFEYENNPERGVSHWDWTLTPIKDSDGRVTGLVLSLLNVTDRIQALEAAQRSERDLKALNESLEARVRERTAEVERQSLLNKTYMSATLDGFFLVETATGRIRDANPAFCAMLDYTQTELLRLSVPDIEASENPQDVAAHIGKLLAQGYDRFETVHRRKDGSLVDVEISASLVEIGGEKMIYVFAYDITPRKQAEAALIRARDEAEHANKAKSEFLSRMSHELRTPMNAILGFAQVLRIEKLSSEQQEYVREITDAGGHLLELINELLDLARIESGRLSANIEPVTFARVAEQAVRLVKPLLEQRQITLHNLCDPDIALLADATRLRQVLVNLLSNAAKYNRQGGIIRIECRPAGSGRLQIAVTDTGPGIAPEQMDKLFRPFERLGAERSDVEGTGIGLVLSRRLTELMGGTMGLESAPGQGSTFWLELARSETSPADVAPAPVPAAAPDHAARHRILYIEDNAANLKVVEAMLRHQPQLALLTATNGEYGLELARRYQPELILLDIHLPDMDGYAVLRELCIHPETRDIPVVALSADAMPMEIEAGFKAGFRDYLTKPVRADVLLETLEKLLGQVRRVV